MEVETLYKRTPEFYADIERQAKKSAQDLAALLTREEIAAYVEQLITLNALQRAQMAELIAVTKPICIGSIAEFEKRRLMNSDFDQQVKQTGSENKILIRCASGLAGKEFIFTLEAMMRDLDKEYFAAGYLEPALLQVLSELEYRLLGTCHKYKLVRGELVPEYGAITA